MNLVTLTQTNNTLNMTSREIATLTDKRHDNVVADIEKLNKTYNDMGLLKVQDTYYTNEQNNQQYRQFILNKEQTLDLITGYTPVLRIKINRRWAELEEQVANPVAAFKIPTTLSEALRLAADQQDTIEAQTERLAIAAPKEQFFDTVAKSNALQSASEIAKKQGISAQALNKVLRDIKMYDSRFPNKNIFKDKVIKQLDGKVVLDKSGRSVSMFTNKGEINIVNNFLYTESAVAIVEAHYHYDDKKLKTYRANLEARRNPKQINVAREVHTKDTIMMIDNLLKQA